MHRTDAVIFKHTAQRKDHWSPNTSALQALVHEVYARIPCELQTAHLPDMPSPRSWHFQNKTDLTTENLQNVGCWRHEDVHRICKILGVSQECTYAVGHAANDIPRQMLHLHAGQNMSQYAEMLRPGVLSCPIALLMAGLQTSLEATESCYVACVLDPHRTA